MTGNVTIAFGTIIVVSLINVAQWLWIWYGPRTDMEEEYRGRAEHYCPPKLDVIIPAVKPELNSQRG